MTTEPVDISRVTVVHNAHKPALGALRFAERLRERGIDVEVVVSDDPAQGDVAARRALDAGSTLIIASGGDGTVRSVLDAVVDAHATLGTLPLGTANDLAMDVGIHSIEDAAQAVIAARAVAWDAGLCTYRSKSGGKLRHSFCSTAGVGLIARAMAMSQSGPGYLLKRVLRNGAWAPLIAASAYASRAVPCVLQLDDVRVERMLGMLEIAKLPAAGGIRIMPDARGDSGILHAWTLENPRMWELPGMLYDGLSGSMRHAQSRHVEYFSREPSQNRVGIAGVTRIGIEGETPLPLHLNGDYMGFTPALFELEPCAFRVLVPPRLAADAVRVLPKKPRGVAAPVPVAQA